LRTALIYSVGVTLREMYIPINRSTMRSGVMPRRRLAAARFFIRRGIVCDINCEPCWFI